MTENIFPIELSVTANQRESLLGHRSCCLWFTGLSGSGKSTIAKALEHELFLRKVHTYVLDGDNIRNGLNKGLSFTDADRTENIRRIAEVSKLFVEAGIIVITSFISPFRAERTFARSLMPEGKFVEVYVDTPIEVCQQRDPKGLYKKAMSGELKNFTGIDSSYEAPENAEIHLIHSDKSSVKDQTSRILAYLQGAKIIPQ